MTSSYTDLKPTYNARELNSRLAYLYKQLNFLRSISGGSAYSLPVASASTLGGIKIGSGLSIDGFGVVSSASSYSLPISSGSVLGGVKVGTGLAIDGAGVLSSTVSAYTLPIATGSVLGGVKVGTGLAIDGAGVLSSTASTYTLPTASGSVLGGVKVGTGLSINGSSVLSSTVPVISTLDDVAQGTARKWLSAADYTTVQRILPLSITQTGHGFVVGNIVRLSGTGTYTKALADTGANSEVAGIVSVVVDANTFVLATGGYITGLSGLTANTTYFLSSTTAGTYTATEPSTVGQISKPVLLADTTTSGYFYNFRGQPIVSGSAVWSVALGKSPVVNNSITLTGTDATTMTFPTTSATVARTDSAQTFTGDQTFSGFIRNGSGITSTSTSSGTNTFYHTAGSSIGINFALLSNNTQTSGNKYVVNIAETFAPTSGTATTSFLSIVSTVNQTGGANGVSRGILIAPTLTAAAAFRALEIANTTGVGIWQTGSIDNYFAGSISMGVSGASRKLNVQGSSMVYKGTALSYADPTATDLIVSNSADNARIIIGQSNSFLGVIQWNYNATTANAYLSLSAGNTTTLNITQTSGVGVNVVSPTSALHTTSFAAGYIAKTTAYTATATDHVIDCTSGSFTITLPTAVGIQGRIYIIKNSGAGTITMAGTSAQTFDGVTSPTLAAGVAAQYMSNNANWIKIN